MFLDLVDPGEYRGCKNTILRLGDVSAVEESREALKYRLNFEVRLLIRLRDTRAQNIKRHAL